MASVFSQAFLMSSFFRPFIFIRFIIWLVLFPRLFSWPVFSGPLFFQIFQAFLMASFSGPVLFFRFFICPVIFFTGFPHVQFFQALYFYQIYHMSSVFTQAFLMASFIFFRPFIFFIIDFSYGQCFSQAFLMVSFLGPVFSDFSYGQCFCSCFSYGPLVLGDPHQYLHQQKT